MFKNITKRALSTTSILNRKYGGRQTAVLIPGDGFGTEMSNYLLQIFKKMQAPVDFEKLDINKADWLEPAGAGSDETLLDRKLRRATTAIRRSGVGLMGNIQTPTEGKHKSANVRIRNELDLFANVIHAKTHPSIETRHKNIDIILIRENTQGEYSGLEHETVPGVIETLKIITQASSKKIAKFAFNYAKDHDRKLVTCIHKANIMKEGDGLFLKTIREIHARPQNCHLQLDDMIVDNTCMQLVKSPEQFDVMVLPNLYGNVVANICCGITGGSGVNAGGNYNKDKSLAVFEVAVRCAGVYDRKQDEANPMAFLKAGQLLLQHCDLPEHAKIINDALQHVYFDEKIHTPDLGGDFGTKDVIKAIDSHISKSLFEKNTVISGNYFTGRPHGY